MFKKTFLALAVIFLNTSSLSANSSLGVIFSPKSQPPTAIEELKIEVYQFLDAYCKNDVEKIKSLVTSQCTLESLLDKRYTSFHNLSSGNASLISRMEAMHQSFDTMTYKIDKIVVGDGQVAVFCEFTMRQVGPFLRILPVKEFLTLRTALFFEFTTGKINKIFEVPDELSFFRQLGNLPL